MTDPVQRPRVRPMPPVLVSLVGAGLGAGGGSMVKGVLIGIEQTDGYFGWLSVPLGAFAGPMMLHADLLLLVEGGPLEHIAVLPWAVPGMVVGAALGLWYGRSEARALEEE